MGWKVSLRKIYIAYFFEIFNLSTCMYGLQYSYLLLFISKKFLLIIFYTHFIEKSAPI